MGLVQNLKKTLKNMVGKVLVELSSHYIKQRAKQTLKRRDNSLIITSSQKPLTAERLPTTIATSLTGTSEKIIMENMTTEDIVSYVRDWSIDRIHSLSDDNRHNTPSDYLNAVSIAEEFDEWIDIDDECTLETLDILILQSYKS